MNDASSGSTPAEWAFCHRILPDVSRTFALNIPVLPPPLRDAVCCAYLLCRIADTIEDAPRLSAPARDGLYARLRLALEESTDRAAPAPLPHDWTAGLPRGYAELVRGSRDVFAAFRGLPAPHRAAIADCVRDMIDGMQRLGRANAPPAPRVTADSNDAAEAVRFVCDDFSALDDYCHCVAGTVGLMLTRLFRHELGDPPALRGEPALERGRRFGLGLQTTNIIKDHHDDLRRGVCFVPPECVRHGEPSLPLTEPGRVRLIRHALSHLDAAMDYVLCLPCDATGVRLFCLWALMLALGTLREAAASPSPKISRVEVAEILETGRRLAADDDQLRAWFAELRGAVVAALESAALRAAPCGAAP